MALRIEILRSEKREIDEIDSKPFTMYLLKVTKTIKETEAEEIADGADQADGAASDPMTVTLERIDGSLGFAFDSYSTGTYLLRTVEDTDAGKKASEAGLKPSMKLLSVNGESVDGLSKFDVTVLLKPLNSAELVWQYDPAGHSIGRAQRLAAMREWTIYRRYSQFDELKNNMQKKYPEIKSLKFPPKVLLGNMKQSVIDQRTKDLGSWLNAMLSYEKKDVRKASDLLAFLEASTATIKEGVAMPNVKLADLHGRVIDTSSMGSEVVVFAAASRYNFQKLTDFVKPAQAEVIKQYPGLRCTFVSVADLRIVPDNMKSMVEPIMKKMEAKDRLLLVDGWHNIASEGYMGIDTFFIPDYSGDALNAIQCADANWTFRVFICMNGQVQKSFQSSMTDLSKKYAEAFKYLLNKYPQAVSKFESSAELASGETKLSARSTHKETIELDQATCVGWEFTVHGWGAFKILAADGSCISPSVTRQNATTRQRKWLPAGKYSFEWKGAGTISSSNLTYKLMKE